MGTKAFITNSQTRKLKKRLHELIGHSAELKFLVGFFYFSGWKELYRTLKERDDLTIKVLVGLQVDKMLGQLMEIPADNSQHSNQEVADQVMESFGKALNAEELDREAFYEQVDFFLDLLEQNRLVIRKTLEPNHAKLYIFKTKDKLQSLRECFFVTGSSNLTKAGIEEQNEFNVELSDFGTDEAEEYFDALWDTAVPITEDDSVKKFLIDMVKNRTQAAEVSPFEAYVMVLKTYIELMEQKEVKPQIMNLLEEQEYKQYRYQVDAVNQALTILDEYQGAIIADVVGLGKSVIASLVAKHLGGRGVIICPPGLMGDEKTASSGWNKYAHDFKLYDWKVMSAGDLEGAAEYMRQWGDDIETVIVDEAHRFRNQDTHDYEFLSTICRNRTTLLLTATPFNNSPADIFSLLKLFIVPGKSGITLEDNLEGRFSHYESIFRRLSYITKNHKSVDPEKRDKAERYYMALFGTLPIDMKRVRIRANQLASEIRNVIEPVLIRRNRLDLKQDQVYSREIMELSQTKSPDELLFELSREQSAFYDDIMTTYFGDGARFKGAIYQPFMYKKEVDEENLDEEGNRTYQQQRNLYDFMRRLLVKRFESSFGSFRQSIENFIRVHKRVLEFIENSGGKYILDRTLVEKAYDSSTEEIEELLVEFEEKLEEKKRRPKHDRIYDVEDFEHKDEFFADIKSDLAMLVEVKDQIDALDLAQNDPKANRVIDEVRRILDELPEDGEPQRKVILFSEYVDTIQHLEPFFKDAFPDDIFVVDGTIGKRKAKELLQNFDASVSEEKQKDDYKVLLTSDILSEGQNLNRAGAIINYDIPWNPTRVIQRVGRINRIGKKVFDDLHIYNFFPTEQGANVVKSRQIAAQKMFLIHNTLGEDTRIFDEEEEPTPSELFKRVNRNPDEAEEPGPLTHIRNIYQEIEENHPDVIERVSNFAYRIKSAKGHTKSELLVFRRKALGFFISHVADPKDDRPSVETIYSVMDSLPYIECDLNEPKLELSETFWKCYEAVKAHKADYTVTHSEISFEVKALNVLKNALNNFKSEFAGEVPFIRTLIKDLTHFRSLPKFTMRRLANIELKKGNKKAVKELKKAIKEIKQVFGEDYLEKLERKVGDTKSEIIIAIENIKK